MNVFWKLPDHWRGLGLAERTALYPAVLAQAGRNIRLTTSADLDASAGAVLVLMAEGALTDVDLGLIETFAGRVAVQPVGGLGAGDLERLARLGAPLIVAREDASLASRYPAPLGLSVIAARGLGARRAEDLLVRGALGAEVDAIDDQAPSPGALLVVGDADGLAVVAPALARARARHHVTIELFISDPERVDLADIGLAGLRLGPEGVLGLAALETACGVAIAYGRAPLGSDRPAIWARSALMAAAPFTASSHPSLDGLANLGVIGDWDRGLDRALAGGHEARAAAISAASLQAERQSPARVALSWGAALDRAFSGGRSRPVTMQPPQLLAFFDLAQDLDVMAPVVEALKARGALSLRIAVSDWLRAESPRTFARLGAAGFEVETISREAAIRGEAPGLDQSAGVLVAADASVEAHRAGRGLTDRAIAAGLPAFSLQHGFENIGLTYRQGGAAVDFGADRVFTWGPAAALPNWVTAQTRSAVRPLGDPKSPALAAGRLAWPHGPWTARVAVFENLHWERYDDAWRARVLTDIAAAAAAAPDTLFLLKPHHAGRWLTRHPLSAPRGRNILLIDPRDPQWEPYTAQALMADADRVATTPSTVAVDAARAGRPVALFGYGLDLSAYAPLPVLQSAEDFLRFLGAPEAKLLRTNEAFLARAFLPGPAAHRIAAAIETRLAEQRANAPARRPMSSLKESVN
ncbi:hypothetical protein [Phenylobacterium immobile]|uniref:hypothetical protein n=1 Tax=Phenylobacterium immobile TaxID=21 RepID=UPI000AE3AFE0|nr:hypothetical protein [Phenylobacterium immobile]